jgi:AraC-like DNA-binding protein
MFRFDQAGRGAPVSVELPPPPALEPFAEMLFVQRGCGALVRAGERWRVVPDPCGHVMFTMSDAGAAGGPARRTSLRVVGARSRYCDVDVSGRLVMFGVRFRPGMLAALVGDQAAALTDSGAPADAVLGRSAARLCDRLAACGAEEGLARIVAFVCARLERRAARDGDAGTNLAKLLSTAPSVNAVARAAGISARTVRERVRRGTGLSPKRLMRIYRLYRALALALAPDARPLAEAAAAAGYADQAHFTREAVDLLGETPRAFRARRFRNLQDRPSAPA